MNDIVIVGAGGLGKEVTWLIENINAVKPTWNILGFIEDESKSNLFGKKLNDYEIIGGNSWLMNRKHETYITCAIGNGKIRNTLYKFFSKNVHIKFATLVDPSVRIDKTVEIGRGTTIAKNCSITVNTNIGDGVLLNIGSLVGHDTEIMDYTTLSPHAIVAGECTIGKFCEIGSGAFIIQGCKVANNSKIGPLSSVLKDITEEGIFIGNPARRIK